MKQACCEFLDSQLDPSNCLGIRDFAETHGCADLMRAAEAFSQKHFPEVVQHEEFILLSRAEVEKLIQCDEIQVRAGRPAASRARAGAQGASTAARRSVEAAAVARGRGALLPSPRLQTSLAPAALLARFLASLISFSEESPFLSGGSRRRGQPSDPAGERRGRDSNRAAWPGLFPQPLTRVGLGSVTF